MRRQLRQFSILLAFLLAAALHQTALAQTTQPTPPAWDQFVSTISNQLSSGDMDSFKSALQDDCSIRAFAGSQPSDCDHLADALSGQTLLTARTYTGPPLTLAADLASDATAPSVPASVKQLLLLPDATQSLNLSAQDPMAVLVFYMPTASDDPAEHPVFVLIKGVEIAHDQYKLCAIAFGDPLGD